MDEDVPLLTDDANWHAFGGAWLIHADSGQAAYFFLTVNSRLGPPQVVARTGATDLSEETGSTGLILRGETGRYYINHTLVNDEP